MNHLPLIRKSLCKKSMLHQAELMLAAKSSCNSSAKLNSRAVMKTAKLKRLHEAELFLAAKPSSCPSSKLNSRIANQVAKAKRLHTAQLISLIKTV